MSPKQNEVFVKGHQLITWIGFPLFAVLGNYYLSIQKEDHEMIKEIHSLVISHNKDIEFLKDENKDLKAQYKDLVQLLNKK